MSTILDLINENSDDSTKIEYAPYVQFVGVKDSKKETDYGLFISDENAQSVGFKVPEGCKIWKKRKHPISGGKFLEGWISQNPRMVILKSSPLSIFSKETGRFVSEFDKEIYTEKTKALYFLKTKYAIILLDENKNPLHEGSLIYNPKNVSGTTFSYAYKDFKADYQKVIGQTRQDPFWINVVFSPKVGYKQTQGGYIVGCYNSYKVPSIDTQEEAQEMINDFITKNDEIYPQIVKEYSRYKDGLTFKRADSDDEEFTPVVATPELKKKIDQVDFQAALAQMLSDESSNVAASAEEQEARESISKSEPLNDLERIMSEEKPTEADPDDIPF